MTVEAALVLPVFIFFLSNILYSFEILRFQCNMKAALHDTGTQICEYASYERFGAQGEDAHAAAALLSAAYVPARVKSYLGGSYLRKSPVSGGSGGISFFRSKVLSEDDNVRLTAVYKVRPFIPFLAPKEMRMENHFFAHAFVGFDLSKYAETGEQQKDEEMVYVTPAGTVYHKDRNCTYLKPSVHSIPAQMLNQARSADGSKYYPCESCHPSRTGLVIITNEGNRFHANADCPAIRRTVKEVPLREVEGRLGPCSKCGR